MRLSFETPTACIDHDQLAQAYVDEAFSTLVTQRLALRHRTVLEATALADGRLRTRIRIVPDLRLPEPMASLVAGHMVYFDEIAVHDPVAGTTEITIETPAGDLVRAGGVASFVEGRDGLVLRFDGSVEVRLPALGALIERRIVAEVQRGCEDVVGVLREYLAARQGPAVSA